MAKSIKNIRKSNKGGKDARIYYIVFIFGVLFALRYRAYKDKLRKEQLQDFYKKINKSSGTDNLTLDLKLQKKWSFARSDHLGGVRYNFFSVTV